MKIASAEDMMLYLERKPLPEICWYGPRANDAACIPSLLKPTGVICCYEAEIPFPTAILSSEFNGVRRKCSIDNLAGELIANEQLKPFLRKTGSNIILPYDSTPELDAFCTANGVFCLSAKDDLKIVLGDKTRIDEVSLAVGLQPIPGVTGLIDEMDFDSLAQEVGLPVFLHFAQGAGGSGNYIVETKEDFEAVKYQRRGKRLNVKKFIDGTSCTMDICVTRQSILCGQLEEMIIGAPPLNTNPTEYVASSWFRGFVSGKIEKETHEACLKIGAWARAQGYLGHLHTDFLVHDDQLFITELNMRFGGSWGVLTTAELNAGRVPLMLAHIISFIDKDVTFDADEIHSRSVGSLDQSLIILKNTKPEAVIIKGEHRDGIYKRAGMGIEWVGKTGSVRDLAAGEFILAGLPPNGRETIVEPGAFIAQAVSSVPLSNGASGLNLNGKILAESTLFALTEPVSDRAPAPQRSPRIAPSIIGEQSPGP